MILPAVCFTGWAVAACLNEVDAYVLATPHTRLTPVGTTSSLYTNTVTSSYGLLVGIARDSVWDDVRLMALRPLCPPLPRSY